MRILSIHNNYLIRGGEDESRESEERLLRENGHIVDTYDEDNSAISELLPVQLAAKTIWSQASYDTVSRMLQRDKYDIVHVQNFFPLISPSVHYAAKAAGVPVVQTLRNYRLLCPNALFFRDGHVCEDCLGKPIPYPGITHGCYRESRLASAAATAMITSHRIFRTWHKQVDIFLALTEFVKQKMVMGGLPADKIMVKPNFVHPDPGPGSGKGNYALYVGRLSVEKGLDILIDAWQQLTPSFPLKIVGDGPLRELVQQATQTNPDIEWLGRRPMTEVHNLMGDASFLIFPSKWYETFGRVAVESFAKGTPVIAADLGAIAELVEDGETGLKFQAGNARHLAEKVQSLLDKNDDLLKMRRLSRERFLGSYTAKKNYLQILDAYRLAKTTVKPQ